MRKNKLIVLLISVLLICSISLSACSLVTTNEERQANRIMASVTVDLAKEFDGIKDVMGDKWDYVVTLDVTRRDLITSVNYTLNYMASLYQQLGSTYNYDVETVMESGLKNLVAQRYRVIRAMGDLLLKSKETGRYDSLYCLTDEYKKMYGNKLVPEGVLTVSERYSAVKTINEQFMSKVESYTENTEDDERNNEKSNANLQLAEYYNEGYFVKSVSIAHKDAEGKFADGLYESVIVDDADEDTSDIDYKKVYVKMTLSASEKEDVYVYVPAEEDSIKVEEDKDAHSTGKYFTAKKVTVTHSGRKYAKVTEENDKGYEVETFTSKAVSYSLVSPRSAYSKKEEEKSTLSDELRYTTIEQWKNESAYTDEMKEIKVEIFDVNPEYEGKEHKDAYRQLRNYFTASNIGFSETKPTDKKSDKYFNYVYYNGLKYYYDSQFDSELLSAKEYELTDSLTVDDSEIVNEYKALVEKDKANYEDLSYKEQVEKFFSTIKSDLSTAYYVPIDALTSVSFEVEPTDKKYSSMFEFDGSENVTRYNDKYVTRESNGKYTMKYAYDNGDGTYTVNMIYVAHILLSLDWVPDLSDSYKNAVADMSDEDKLKIVKIFAEASLRLRPQKLEYLEKYEERAEDGYEYTIDDIFGDEKEYKDVMDELNTAFAEVYGNSGKSYVALMNKFIEMMEIYNDDSGKLSGSGYLVSAGDMENTWYADFTDTALKIYFNLLNQGKPMTGYGEVNGIDIDDLIMDAYSDYGVHKMMISFAPLYRVNIDEENNGIGLDTVLKLDGTTWRETISKNLTDKNKETVYDAWEESFSEKEIQKHTTQNEKNYKALVKEIAD